MSAATAGLLATAALTILAVLVACAAPDRWRAMLTGAAVAAVGVAGLVTGALVLAGSDGSVEFQVALPFGPLTFAPTSLGAVFMIITGAVGAVAAIYGIGYASGPANSRVAWSMLAVFLTGMQMVAASAGSVSFLLSWEVMALASAALVLTEHRCGLSVRSAALWYCVMTQLSFLLVLAGFGVLSASTGTDGFGVMPTPDPRSPAASLAFVLLTLGFACKSGLVPLHVWLPRAHPEAPSHVSALMSAAMVNLGVYGALLVILRLLPGGPQWWGVLLLTLGALSAAYGILQASVENRLKRLLAYSTTENMGLAFVAAGTSVVLRAGGMAAAADAALVACLLLVVSHAAFKTALFLGAGSVIHASGEGDLDRLGGLARNMPWTAASFGVGALGAAALPVSAGFVAEWVLLQALLHGAPARSDFVSIAMPAAVAVVALATGLALMTFVKAFGIGFLGNPRSARARDARESRRSMRLAMVLSAAAVLAVGLVPGFVAPQLAAAVGAEAIARTDLAGLALPGLGVLLDPLALVLLAGSVLIPVAVATLLSRRVAVRRRDRQVWQCGNPAPSARMQYSATSFAEPVVRVFDDALQPSRTLTIIRSPQASHIITGASFRQRVTDIVDTRCYRPLIRTADRAGDLARRVQNGSIHRYLLFSFAALLVVLVAVTL